MYNLNIITSHLILTIAICQIVAPGALRSAWRTTKSWFLYEEFTMLAETRLAQNTWTYIKLA